VVAGLAAVMLMVALIVGLVLSDPFGASGDAPVTAVLTRAVAPPAPAPDWLKAEPPLRPDEVYAFAPWWTLGQSAGFDLTGVTTLAYFSLDVGPDGALQRSGSGWQGFGSQALADLVTRAHAAGTRVVLTVTCFDQSTLDRLTHDPTAPPRLASGVLAAIGAENLDGVNLDLEGVGGRDQAGLTALVSRVSEVVHRANAHYQVTVDTYASSAGDPGGFYDVPGLARVTDGVVVEQYQLNLQAPASASSPLTSGMYSDRRSIEEYTAAMPAAKVILAAPAFGYEWPTSDGTLRAHGQGGADTVTVGWAATSGHPIYWDTTTQTAWTSYIVGTQWHEAFFENADSMYLIAGLAHSYGLGGVGLWALGMDGSSSDLLSALAGNPPAPGTMSTGPTITSPSRPAPHRG
jgi:hypothetical protein